jgi:hypothetical protein
MLLAVAAAVVAFGSDNGVGVACFVDVVVPMAVGVDNALLLNPHLCSLGFLLVVLLLSLANFVNNAFDDGDGGFFPNPKIRLIRNFMAS